MAELTSAFGLREGVPWRLSWKIPIVAHFHFSRKAEGIFTVSRPRALERAIASVWMAKIPFIRIRLRVFSRKGRMVHRKSLILHRLPGPIQTGKG